jgi:non-heme chloroperoxidase
MRPIRILGGSGAMALCLLTTAGCGQPTGIGDPPTAFRERIIAANGTTLHTIDYGGVGVPIVFLAGLGNSAHIFDEFAPRFTNAGHVLAFTRRGYGQSGRPTTGYDARSLANDVVALLDSLRLTRAVLVGHSVAGDELSEVAASHPGRVLGVAYIDAAFDRSATLARVAEAIAINALPPTPPDPTASDTRTLAAFQSWLARLRGYVAPLADVRATYRTDAAGRVTGTSDEPSAALRIVEGERAPQLSAISGPMLLMYAVNRSVATEFPWIATLTTQRAAAESQAARYLDWQQRFEAQQRAVWRAARPAAQVVEVANGSHYLFLTNADAVESALRTFIAGAAP